ncbi:hypothetical protein [Methylomonas rivi]|uniref:Uncharacterized protein n=1 Tax=Methylomonas rivi TaxID=2952226 RepID=A0ABT1U580_9GAMM|nr:hypothetical protein [Methylomonas sp. WSC-6]MBS4050797.1 hypothetical protein [Methylomonas sp.]MCQ8129017.1 hypothetical protein [Methylomonas sp. WSC-6]
MYTKGVFEGFYVSEDEVIEFRNNHIGFSQIDLSRVSQFLSIQLASIHKHRVYNSFSITDVIQDLEGVGRGCKRRVAQFKHPPLKGLWKVHFFDPRFMVKNLINHWGLERANSPKLNNLFLRIDEDEEKSPSTHGWHGRLAHEMTVVGYEERARKNNLTGEWIIFLKYKGKNYYLCISRHTSPEEDRDVYEFLKNLCEHEYPFLLPIN